MTIVSSYIPFPNIAWWATAIDSDTLLLDKAEHFQKMSYRNKYCISGSNGSIQLSIPIENGRNQRAAMKDIKIAPEKWQVQHWRTITSVYGRSPFFEYYSDGLLQLFETTFSYLIDFNLATLLWMEKQLKLSLNKTFTEEYLKTYDNAVDLRNLKPAKNMVQFPEYYQVFSDRTGFLPNLSILDLFFSEGPNTIKWIQQNKERIQTS